MDKPHNASAATPGYETRDANAGGVFKFLVALGIVLVVAGLVCWGLFRYFSAHAVNQAASDSPFADTRQLPLGPQLQVNPREDWLKFREEQEQVSRNLRVGKSLRRNRARADRRSHGTAGEKRIAGARRAASAARRCKEASAGREQEAMSRRFHAAMLVAPDRSCRFFRERAAGNHARDPEQSGHHAKSERADSAGPRVSRRDGKVRAHRRLFWTKADRAFPGLLRLPRALHGSSERGTAHDESDLARSRQGFRRGDGQLRAERYSSARQGEARRLRRAVRAARRRGSLALPDGRAAID